MKINKNNANLKKSKSPIKKKANPIKEKKEGIKINSKRNSVTNKTKNFLQLKNSISMTGGIVSADSLETHMCNEPLFCEAMSLSLGD